MKQTTNYNLNKPDPTDYIKVEDFNENADIIDTELKELHDEKASLASDFTAHQAESATQAHLAKNIGLEDTTGNFVATNVEGAMSELFTNVSNGKNLVGGAITGVDDSVVIPTDPTFGDLASAIAGISTGKKWASGVITSPMSAKKTFNPLPGYGSPSSLYYVPLNFSSLDFVPSFVIIKRNNTYPTFWGGEGLVYGHTVSYDRLYFDVPYQNSVVYLPVQVDNVDYDWIAFE